MIVVTLFVFLGMGGRAMAGCPPFPSVEWWEGLSHEQTQRYVEIKYNGDWDAYIAKWHRQLSIIENIYARGKAALMRSKQVRLSGEDLRKYILQIENRISIIECLAAEAKAKGSARGVAPTQPTEEITVDVPRADQPKRRTPRPTGSQFVDRGALKVEITTQCSGGDTIFRIVNRGGRWPEPAQFIVHRTTDKLKLTDRKIKMAQNQSIAFRVKGDEPMELRVIPPWRKDDFRIAQAHCR